MKRVIALLLSTLMIIGLFAGCSGGGDSSESASESSEESSSEESKEESAAESSGGESESAAESTAGGETGDRGTPDEDGVYPFGIPAVDEPVTIKVEREKSSQDVGTDYNKDKWAVYTNSEQTGINIEWTILANGTSGDKIPIELADGVEIPDVYFELIGQDRILQYEHLFYPIDGLFDTYAKNIYEDMSQVPNWEKMAYTPSGHVYSGFGFYQNLYENSMDGIQIMNTQWLENVGLEMPTDWTSYMEVLQAFHDQDANGNGDTTDEIPYGWATNMWCADLWDCESGRFGIATDYYSSTTNNAFRFFEITDGKVVPTRNTDQYRKYLDVMHEMVSAGLIDSEGFTDGWDELGNKVKNDKIGTYNCWTALEYMGTEQASHWDTMERFGYDGDGDGNPDYDVYQNGVKNRTTANATVWVVTNKCETPNAAVRYWDHAAEDIELSLGFAQGEKGKLWDQYEDGSGYYFLVPDGEEGMNYENMKYTWGFVNGCPMIPTKEIPKNDPAQSEAAALRDTMCAKVEQYALDESRRILSTYVPEDKMQELSLYEQDIANVINNFHGTAIVSGYTDDDWNKYVAQLDQYKYNDLIEWYQHKYDNDWE